MVGIIWQKIGTPTRRAQSGTVEEINRSIENTDKQFLVYFKTTPPESLNDIDTEQLNKIKQFKSELSQKGVLYKEFNSTSTFESLFRIHLANLISDKFLRKPNDEKKIIADNRYAEIASIITEIESKKDINDDIDVFELTENAVSTINTITSSLNNMTHSLNEIGEIMVSRTAELSKYLNIKDDRLRIQKCQIVVNLFADELNEFNKKLELEKEILSPHFLNIAPQYSRLLHYEKMYSIGDVNLRESFIGYRDSINSTTHQSAEFLKVILTWPPSTSKFNKSKRETEIVIKDITKLFLEGLKLMDEILEIN